MRVTVKYLSRKISYLFDAIKQLLAYFPPLANATQSIRFDNDKMGVNLVLLSIVKVFNKQAAHHI